MDLHETLSGYAEGGALSLPWLSRYSMYGSSFVLMGVSCLTFGYLVSINGWYFSLGLVFLWLLLVVHPSVFWRVLDPNRGVIRAKPFISFFYISYMLAIPTVAVVYLGYGRSCSLGSNIIPPRSLASAVTINYLSVNYEQFEFNRDYFETVDGFVAYNLSKSLVHTLNAHDLEISDSIYYGLNNPVVESIFGVAENITYKNPHVSEINLFDPLATDYMYTDIITQWTVAPIFQQVDDCLTQQPPVHVTCLIGNIVLGWAMSTDYSGPCRGAFESSSCSSWGNLNQKMSVYYPANFSMTEPVPTVSGLQGMLSSAPPAHIVEAIKRRYSADGFPFDVDVRNYPNGMPMLFVQINDNVASDIQTASDQFLIFKYISIIFLLVVGLAIFCPLYMDIRSDYLLLSMIESQKHESAEMANAEIERQARRRTVALSVTIN